MRCHGSRIVKQSQSTGNKKDIKISSWKLLRVLTDGSAPPNSMAAEFANPAPGLVLIAPHHALTESTIFSWPFLTAVVTVHFKKLKVTLCVYYHPTLWEIQAFGNRTLSSYLHLEVICTRDFSLQYTQTHTYSKEEHSSPWKLYSSKQVYRVPPFGNSLGTYGY